MLLLIGASGLRSSCAQHAEEVILALVGLRQRVALRAQLVALLHQLFVLALQALRSAPAALRSGSGSSGSSLADRVRGARARAAAAPKARGQQSHLAPGRSGSQDRSGRGCNARLPVPMLQRRGGSTRGRGWGGGSIESVNHAMPMHSTAPIAREQQQPRLTLSRAADMRSRASRGLCILLSSSW